MANFFTDNDDILFRFKTIDLGQLAGIREEGFRFAGDCDYAPADAAEAVENYRLTLTSLGQLAEILEEGFKFAKEFEHAPAGAAEAVENYRLTLTSLGQLAAEFIAPRAEDVDATGPVLQEDGLVAYAAGYGVFSAGIRRLRVT